MIKVLFMDVDGTLTDGKINIGENGEIFKSFNVKDGFGIKKMMRENILPVIVTGRCSKIVEYRCAELGITKIYQNISNKEAFITKYMSEMNISKEEAAFIGDDDNDLEAMKLCGISFAPCDASKAVKQIATIILQNKGGEGCVREAIEIIMDENYNL